ncbi:MAG: 50S ribosomal protein L20 [Candidatus Omnitrophica bacterium]|nr:50S ribosomal protein L20 [Candidatus Omnitrophota bacterium]
MPRSTNNVASRARRKKVLKRAKGFVGGRRKLFRTAKETVMRAMRFATRDRKVRKREFRQLWTVRINAGCRELGVSYSRFINALQKKKVGLDRKSLAEIAVRDAAAFKEIVQFVMGGTLTKASK